MKSLTIIFIGYDGRVSLPSEEFWRRYDTGEFNK
jgi:hypothetical protein